MIEFIQRYSDLFKTHIDRRKEESYQRFRVANQRVHRGAVDVNVFSSTFCDRGASGGSTPAKGSPSKTSSKRPRAQSSKDGSSGVSSVKSAKKTSKKQSSIASSSKKRRTFVVILNFVSLMSVVRVFLLFIVCSSRLLISC